MLFHCLCVFCQINILCLTTFHSSRFQQTEVQKLQDAYTKLNEDKEKLIAEVKAAGLGLMKSVLKAPKDGKDEL